MAKKYIEGKAAPLREGQIRVKSGDSLWKLAEQYTGSGSNWSQLNNGKKLIKPGDVIDVPKKLWNPLINVNGTLMRWRSKEYKEAYPNLVDSSGGRTLEGINVSPKTDIKGAVTKTTDYVGRETAGTIMNTIDMPRRIVAGVTNPDYTMKEALNPIGTQPYHSVVSDAYAKEHPYIAAGADIGTGLLAWNLPGITKSLVKTGVNVSKASGAMARASDDVARINALSPKDMSKAVKATKEAASKTSPLTHDYITSAVGKGGNASGKVGNVQVSSKAGVVSKGTGTTNPAKGNWLGQRRPTNIGKVNSAYQQGGFSGHATYAIPKAPVVPFSPIPIPGIPVGLPPRMDAPPYIPKARIETTTPGQISLSEIIRRSKASIGDTIVMPSGEQIRYVTGGRGERYIDTESRKVYDENSKNVAAQKRVPDLESTTFRKGNEGVNKYYPAVPEGMNRASDYYPEIVDGKAEYRPIRYEQGGSLISKGEWLKNNYKNK